MTEPTPRPNLADGYTIKFNASKAIFHVTPTGAVRHICMPEYDMFQAAGLPHVDGADDTAAAARLMAEARVSQGFLQK